jgi:TetR/AcrR family transcriptional regulator
MNNDSIDSKLSRKEREFLARRREILEAATRLFARKGYHGTAMSEIAKEAEFSTGSLYNFFQNKEELYFTLLREKIEALETEVYAVLASDAGVDERLRIWVDQVLAYFERERDFFRIFAEQRTQFESTAKGEFSDVIHEKIQNYLAQMVLLMEQGVKQGLFKPLAPAELAMIFFGITNNILVVFLNSDKPYDLRSKGSLILDIFFNGTRQQIKDP